MPVWITFFIEASLFLSIVAIVLMLIYLLIIDWK